jgi:hypothetical protein
VARALISALRNSSALATALVGLGCGGGVPLLHGAHTLGPGSTASAAGFSSTFTAGAVREAVDAARASDVPTTRREEVGAREAAVIAAISPGVAPFAAMRVGIPGDNEVGLSYTGRLLRLDARHAFESGPLALSLGAGARATWNTPDKDSEPAISRIPGRVGSIGFDVPVLVGWRSSAGIVSIWGGARGGLERISNLSSGAGAAAETWGLTHWHVGGIAGLAVGFRHVHAAVELETSYHGLQGTLAGTAVEVRGLTLTPAGGLLFTF